MQTAPARAAAIATGARPQLPVRLPMKAGGQDETIAPTTAPSHSSGAWEAIVTGGVGRAAAVGCVGSK